MTDTVIETIKEANQQETQKKFSDPYEYLATVTGAPSKIQLEAWKAQTPNNRLRVFTPDAGKRVFIVRAIGAMELQRLQASLPQNLGAGLPPEQQAAKIEFELQLAVASHCVMWTNASGDGKLNPDLLRAGSAGLPGTLFQLISWLSDFMDPAAFDVLSIEI
jgi:hypothetical protein